MQREAAGIAKEVPTMSLEAERNLREMRNWKVCRNLQISHQTGDQSMALPFQMMELMNWMKQARPVHAM